MRGDILFRRAGVATVAALLALGFCGTNLRAQIVPDGGTVVLSNTTNSFTGDVIIGTNGPFTLLVISNNASLTNSGNGIVGGGAGANSNEVRLVSPTARWRMGVDLAIGEAGKGNSLTVSNGAYLENHIGLVGYFIGSDSNRVRVTGMGSVWSNRSFVAVGYGGNGDTLTIDNGGMVRDQDFYVGEQASNNVVTVTGSGSILSNQFDLTVGDFGNNNQMFISAGGLAMSWHGYVGKANLSSNNFMFVSGAGSTWSNWSDLYVGGSGKKNLLGVDGGARVYSDYGRIGVNAVAVSNTVTLGGSGTLWTNVEDLYVGQNGSFNQLIASNGAVLWSSNGVVGANSVATGNVAVVTGGASWSNRADLIVGQFASGNQLIAGGGAVLFAALNNTIGMQPGANSNSVLLADAGTRWIQGVNSQFTVGSNGGYCSLILSNGATILGARIATIGYNSGTNFALITGTNSILDSGLNTIVGFVIGGNRLAISNGGVASCAGGTLGLNSTSSNNEAIVTGPGSLWSNRFDTTIGSSGGGGNRLTVNGGAKLYTGGNATLGSNPGVNSNVCVFADAGTKWLRGVNTTIVVGDNGAFNLLVISNGPTASSRITTVGNNSGTNQAIVTGAGSSVVSDLNTIVGFTSTGNRFVVSNGGFVGCAGGTICLNNTSSNNEAIITGPGSLWSNRFDFIVGADGAGARVIVTNSGLVTSSNTITIGLSATSLNNRLIVDGGGLEATNPLASAALTVIRGTNVFNAGLIEVDRLQLTNVLGRFEFNGGRLRARGSSVSNGLPFVIGNGTSQAIFEMVGGGTHAIPAGVRIQAGGQLVGNGFIAGLVTNSASGVFAPGTSIGAINVIGSLRFESGSTNSFEVNAAAATNDLATATGSITYGGTLIVTNIAGSILPGTSFKLFNATVYAGAFTTLILPTLTPGLTWSNRLVIDGSIRVMPPRDRGLDVSHFQGEGGISQSTWTAIYNEGKTFAFIKATEGLTGPDDAAMANNMNRAVIAGLRAGVYHYAHPENRPTTNGAVAEADHLLTYAGNFIGPGYLRPVIDLEFAASSLTTTELSDWVVAFANEIVAQRGPGAVPIIYCNQSFANVELDSRMAAYDLWLRTTTGSDPLTTEPVPSGFPTATGNFTNYAFWQYTGSGSSGGISPIDLDVCHNEFRPLDAYLITSIPSPVAPTIAVQPQSQSVAAGASPSFSVTPTVTSSTPITYQWRFNGTNIGGATGSIYTRPNVQAADQGPFTVVLSNAAGSVTSIIAQLTVYSPVAIYQENFDEYATAITVTNADTTNGFKIFFNAASASAWDFSAVFGFDYSTVSGPSVVPSAPHSTNGTSKGLLLAVNKDASPIVAAVNLYPTNRFFSGSFALKFDMWINWNTGSGTTEHSMFGINHSGDITNRIGLVSSDGLFFTVDGDGGINATSGTQRDFAPYLGGGTNAIPIIKTNGFGPAAPLGAQFDNANAGFVSLFPSQVLSFTTPAGSAGMRWIAVEVRQETNLVTWYMNDTLIAQYTNSTTYTNGNIMIGYSDNSASLGDPLDFAIIDNLRVETIGSDSDGNGLPDAWEVQYFGTFGVDPNADADGDGMSNAAEFAAGTNPTNAASAFKFAGSSYSTTDVTLQWATVGGHSYQVQIMTNTTGSVTGNFVNLSPVIYVPGVGEGTTNYVHVGGGTNRAAYYRVQLVP